MMSFGRAFGRAFGRTYRPCKFGARPVTDPEALTIADDAEVGDLVCTLSVESGTGTYAFTITTNDYFELDAGDDTRVLVKAPLAVGILQFTILADNGVTDPISRTFTVNVTAA